MNYLCFLLISLISVNALQVTRPFKAPTSKTSGWHPIGFSHKINTKPQRVEFNNIDGGFKALVVWRSSDGEIFARPDMSSFRSKIIKRNSFRRWKFTMSISWN